MRNYIPLLVMENTINSIHHVVSTATKSGASIGFLKQQLVGSILQAVSQIQQINKIPIPIREQNIFAWAHQFQTDSQNITENALTEIMREYMRILTQCFDIIVNSVLHSARKEDAKVFKVSSNKRKKIRVINQNEHLSQKYQPLQIQRERDLQFKEIFELKNKNKKLEKQVLQICVQFRKLKVQYEREIQKYRDLLSSSLGNLIANAQELKSHRISPQNKSHGQRRDTAVSVVSAHKQEPYHSQAGTQHPNTLPTKHNKTMRRFLSDRNLPLY